MKIFKVYILFSKIHNRIYIGQTNDFEKRILRHNNGLVRSTKAFRPWEIIYSEEFRTRSEAMKREKWLKSSKGREFIKSIPKDSGIASA